MRSDDSASDLPAPRAARLPVADGASLDDTRGMPRVVAGAPVATVAPPVGTPAELSGMLLPSEAVTFASSPHWIVFVRPAVHALVILILLATVLSWQWHPIVRGHHVTVFVLTGAARTAALGVAALLLLREAFSLVRRLMRYFGFRVVTTNRRVFVVEGLFGRRVTPLSNTALAGTTMWQGFFGRMLGYGNLALPPAASWTGTISEMCDPVKLYREFEAVAQGVDGDHWTPAVRQTLIP
jgi:Bacterial PH domain